MRITAVTCVKNEGPFLLEWIAFNRLIGVTDHLFYSNDCTDGTDELLEALQDRGLVQHLPNPAQGRNYQMEALKDAKRWEIVTEADWVWVADVDEFLNIHVGDHTIPALVEACGNPQAISLHFQFFSDCGIEKYADRPIIEQFTRSHNPDLWCGETAIEVKSLMRHDFPLKYFGAHRPFFRDKLPKKKHPTWTDGAGRTVPHRFLVAANPRRIRKFPAQGAREYATLNHYALRSLDSYLVKNDRGDVNRENRAFDDTYWRERNDDVFLDTSIHRYLPDLKSALDDLKSDSKIKALHDKAVAAHITKRDELLAQPAYRGMYEQLRTAPRISPQEQSMLVELGLAS
ncbi:glycosyltransferase family 2 protein [Alisedimentitalea sp. MJ-SS2]|uniref:glycosyltransferase family 2 protein n=1 Tax=Aliisedimentitalea sp. MJ-SS2 TaxID=3049795 RepID=UPI00290C19EA|nr:glycosyltransferase family 2 protein [Alisedimentitalea sp. MJ-SS2]MDU8926689.1 glycosyltransferase family 2 protein [Alisedimentitalea sp. MJ-SS2]